MCFFSVPVPDRFPHPQRTLQDLPLPRHLFVPSRLAPQDVAVESGQSIGLALLLVAFLGRHEDVAVDLVVDDTGSVEGLVHLEDLQAISGHSSVDVTQADGIHPPRDWI